MVNDILEQIAEDYFRNLGYFTQHNIKYRPEKGVHSDIDLIAIHPLKEGISRVVVVSCKADQQGLDIEKDFELLEKDPEKVIKGRTIRKKYQEMADPIWANALINKIQELTNQQEFTFYTFTTHFKGNRELLEKVELFKKNLKGCDLKIIDLKTAIMEIWDSLTTTPAHSGTTRLLQLIKAGKGKITY